MNKQQKSASQRGIEWTDYTSNPVRGCKHQCRWTMPDGSLAICYAELVAQRVAQKAFPAGFEAHYWNPLELQAWHKLQTPARIFLDSMSDLMGSWVPDEQVLEVLDHVRRAEQHTFQLLTKAPGRLRKFSAALPKNLWVGVSAPPSKINGRVLTPYAQRRYVDVALTVLHGLDVPVKWMSLEPLSFDIAPLMGNCGLQWAVIGAATNGVKVYQPQAEWVTNLLSVLDAQHVAVFFKGNIRGNMAITRWREEFPGGAFGIGHEAVV